MTDQERRIEIKVAASYLAGALDGLLVSAPTSKAREGVGAEMGRAIEKLEAFALSAPPPTLVEEQEDVAPSDPNELFSLLNELTRAWAAQTSTAGEAFYLACGRARAAMDEAMELTVPRKEHR